MPDTDDAIANSIQASALGTDLIELKHIEQVVEICSAGSITDAAHKLKLTQPALSKSLAKLERQLGIKLFKRTAGGLQPTDYGQFVAIRGRALLNSALMLRREIDVQASGGGGLLRIGVAPSARIRPLRAIIPEVSARFPELRLEIVMENEKLLLEGMADNRFDIVLVYHRSARLYGGLMRVKLLDDRIVSVARPQHPIFALETSLTIRELLKFRIASAGLNQKWLSRMTSAERVNATAIRCEDFNIIADCALSADVIAVGPHFAFEHLLERGELVEVPNGFSERYACWLVSTPEHWNLPVVREIIRIGKQVASRRPSEMAP